MLLSSVRFPFGVSVGIHHDSPGRTHRPQFRLNSTNRQQNGRLIVSRLSAIDGKAVQERSQFEGSPDRIVLRRLHG